MPQTSVITDFHFILQQSFLGLLEDRFSFSFYFDRIDFICTQFKKRNILMLVLPHSGSQSDNQTLIDADRTKDTLFNFAVFAVHAAVRSMRLHEAFDEDLRNNTSSCNIIILC